MHRPICPWRHLLLPLLRSWPEVTPPQYALFEFVFSALRFTHFEIHQKGLCQEIILAQPLVVLLLFRITKSASERLLKDLS